MSKRKDDPIDRLRTLEEEIARHLQEALDSGELKAAKGFGRPLPEVSGWDETPEALRMPFKILKDAGVPPPEIELFHERARLRQALEACADESGREALRRQLSELEQKIALRLEALRINARL
jgi:hypothetical protein